MGIVGEALKGAYAQVMAAPTISQKLHTTLSLTSTFARELAGMFSLFPHIFHAFLIYASLPPKRSFPFHFMHGGPPYRAALLKNLRYGTRKRNLLDVYIPQNEEQEGQNPVAMFVHGGTWASGEKWLFSLLGAQLAHHGIVAILVQYTLYPQVLAAQQVDEINEALSWTMRNVQSFGGNPERVYLIGHSAGGHLCALSVWERLNRIREGGNVMHYKDVKVSQPHCFIGLSGVYDIGDHYLHEQKRGVEYLSCMARAMGGHGEFKSMSPALLFASLPPNNNAPCPLPNCLLISSPADATVPLQSSLALHSSLLNLGCSAQVKLYDNIGHEKFVFWSNIWGQMDHAVEHYVNDVIAFIKSS